MKKLNRLKKDYISEFSFFFILYFSFGYFILGLSGNKSLLFYLSLLVFGVTFSFICSEIFTRKHYGYNAHQTIAIPILITFIILNFNFLNLIN